MHTLIAPLGKAFIVGTMDTHIDYYIPYKCRLGPWIDLCKADQHSNCSATKTFKTLVTLNHLKKIGSNVSRIKNNFL